MSKAVKVLKHTDRPKGEGTYQRLVCLTGADKGKAYYFMENRAVMGRGDTADIRVMDIKSSREHAEIVKVGKDFVITDLGSQNGIVVNDLKVKQEKLSNGDVVIIGQTAYKFGEVIVGPTKKISIDNNDDFKDEEFKEEMQTDKSSKRLIIIGIVVIVFTFIFMDDETEIKRTENRRSTEVIDPFSESFKQQKKLNSETKKKMNQYFQNGLREFREGNYFRAMSEFNHALTWVPNDPLAQFYLRKTKDALDKKIEGHNITAKRDEEALKFQEAVVSYCSIMRLLHNYPTDPRYKEADENVRKMEGKLGLDENEIVCVEKIDVETEADKE